MVATLSSIRSDADGFGQVHASNILIPEPECFVCCDASGTLYQVCKCSTLLHEECFQRLVNDVPAHGTHCPVCKHPYDLRLQKEWRCHGNTRFGVMTMMNTTMLGGLTFCLTYIPVSTSMLGRFYYVIICLSASCVVGMQLTMTRWYHQETGRWSPLWIMREVTSKKVQLSP